MKVHISSRQRKIRLSQTGIKKDSLKTLRILGLDRAELGILFVSPERMKALNLKYRGVHSATDVLSFGGMGNSASPIIKGAVPFILGDVVICPSVAYANAKEHGISFKDEIKWLLVHGILHLLGYDHEGSAYQAGKMRAMERHLLGKLGYSNV